MLYNWRFSNPIGFSHEKTHQPPLPRRCGLPTFRVGLLDDGTGGQEEPTSSTAAPANRFAGRVGRSKGDVSTSGRVGDRRATGRQRHSQRRIRRRNEESRGRRLESHRRPARTRRIATTLASMEFASSTRLIRPPVSRIAIPGAWSSFPAPTCSTRRTSLTARCRK